MLALDIFERYTAVDDEFDSSDVAAFVTGKINRGPSDIPGIAAESHRNLPVACTPHFLDVASSVAFVEAGALLNHRRLHPSRLIRVQPNTSAGILDVSSFSKLIERGF